MAAIIVKQTVKSKRDGDRTWRLWSDGRVDHTNSKSNYQQYMEGETPPAALLTAAKKAGIDVHPGRPEWRTRPRKPPAALRNVKHGFSFTAREMNSLRANAAAAEKTLVDYIVARCCD